MRKKGPGANARKETRQKLPVSGKTQKKKKKQKKKMIAFFIKKKKKRKKKQKQKKKKKKRSYKRGRGKQSETQETLSRHTGARKKKKDDGDS